MSISSHSYHWMKTGFRPAKSRLSRWRAQANQIIKRGEALKTVTDDELERYSLELRWRAKSGEPLKRIMPEAYALVRESAWRTLKMAHFPVQLMGGIALFEGGIAEMQTGEGKTLSATMPVYLNALTERGVNVITVNDYLAKRDAEWMSKVYTALGMSTGVVYPRQPDAEKREAYKADITYATNNELGFDYLRDNMRANLSDMAQRGHNFAIVDEVDSILIDEARTPLIISGPSQDRSEMYVTIDKVIPLLQPDHYELDEKSRNVTFTDDGISRIAEIACQVNESTENIGARRLYTVMERVFEELSFTAPDRAGEVIEVNAGFVEENLGELTRSADLSRYVL